MRTLFGLITLVAFLGSNGVTIADDKKEKSFDPEKLIGTWTLSEGVKFGEKVPAERLKEQSVVITKEKLTLKGSDTFVMKYDLNTKVVPVTVDLEITESPFGGGAKAKGIFELDGDTLKFCYNASEGEAPKQFESTKDNNFSYYVLKRSK